MDTKKQHKSALDTFHYNGEVNLRSILREAIRMQALYTGKRVKIVESSRVSN